MPPAEWSKLPELTIKKNEPAKFDGVLVPELNYRNYKSFEEMEPVYQRLSAAGDLPVCQDASLLSSPYFWGLLGVIAGAIAEASVHR